MDTSVPEMMMQWKHNHKHSYGVFSLIAFSRIWLKIKNYGHSCTSADWKHCKTIIHFFIQPLWIDLINLLLESKKTYVMWILILGIIFCFPPILMFPLCSHLLFWYNYENNHHQQSMATGNCQISFVVTCSSSPP